jgi:hypothetical protein
VKCGQAVEVVDWNGVRAATAVSQCGGGFLVIVNYPDWNTHDAPFRNGELLWGWPQLLERLIWLAAHPVSTEYAAFAYMARRGGDEYVQMPLNQQMPASELAKLLDAPPAEVKARLHDYIVVPEPDEEAPSGDGG